MDAIEKQRLRQAARFALAEIPDGMRHSQGWVISGLLDQWPLWRRAERVGAYMAITGEPILELEWMLQKNLLLPRLDGDRLRFLRVGSTKDLEHGAYGICQPRQDLIEEEPDLVLVPGLAFDPQGRRLGRGKGFYDRFLEGRPVVRVGVALVEALVTRVPMESHDQAMHHLVTAQGIQRC